MLLKNKLLILSIIFSIIAFLPSNQVLGFDHLNSQSIKSNQKTNALSGNISIIIYNYEAYYTDYQLNQIRLYVGNLGLQYSGLHFNIVIINSTSDLNYSFKNELGSILTSETPNYVIIMGGVSNLQSSYLGQLKDWMIGANFTTIKDFGLINYMKTSQDFFTNPTLQYGLNSYFNSDNKIHNNISLANIDYSQAGFMSGIQAAMLTKTDKIGIILDHSMQVTFDNKLNSPQDSSGYPIYSFDRVNFVTGFIAGVQYASEVYLDGSNILLKSVGFDLTDNFSAATMGSKVVDLHNFGADVIFNMESSLDSEFIQKSDSIQIKSGVLGTNDSSASFSFEVNTQNIIGNFLNEWNSSVSGFDWTYNLANSSVLSLSSMKDSRLTTVKTLVLNGTIKILDYNYYLTQSKLQEVPGFEVFFVALLLLLITSKKKIKK